MIQVSLESSDIRLGNITSYAKMPSIFILSVSKAQEKMNFHLDQEPLQSSCLLFDAPGNGEHLSLPGIAHQFLATFQASHLFKHSAALPKKQSASHPYSQDIVDTLSCLCKGQNCFSKYSLSIRDRY